MDVTQTGSAVSYASQARAAPADGARESVISSDFETFLKMLTVQMENQDPLNPIESSDYAVQLATFSGVEQQVQTNDLLKAVQSQLGMMGMSDLVGWVGMEARAATSARFDMAPVEAYPAMPENAQQAFMVVRDASGEQVDRVQIPVSSAPVEWAGLNKYGQLFEAGDYSFHLQAIDATGKVSESRMAVYSEVTEARVENGQTVLVLASGDEIGAEDVNALRMPKD